ncbi:Mth938-like domain-containing protein [Legionella gresilensis]|uniref:Mth938-like domain-containing protein n=1 Tax=Legionella gresilensis TaxID=91823 RepID=UPI0010418B46|nr:MTH938/NDUFAF3 family protein [Legionella gresilensis]
MHISLENSDQYAIQGYSETEVKIDSVIYEHNIIVSKHGVITDWPLSDIQHLKEENLVPLLTHSPNIIIIGHALEGKFAPISLLHTLSNQRISLESMSIGAACRTYNILLNEQREVALGLILS